MIYFTTSDMVVGETITIDHLLSVYQGDANAVSDEGYVSKNYGGNLIGRPSRTSEAEVTQNTGGNSSGKLRLFLCFAYTSLRGKTGEIGSSSVVLD